MTVFTFKIRKTEFGEFRVRFFANGKSIGNDSDYFTNHRGDAERTGQMEISKMAKREAEEVRRLAHVVAENFVNEHDENDEAISVLQFNDLLADAREQKLDIGEVEREVHRLAKLKKISIKG